MTKGRRRVEARYGFLFVAALGLPLTVGGCSVPIDGDRWRPACESVGLCEPPPKASEDFDVLIDPSLGSTGDRETMTTTLRAVLKRASIRPGSHVRLWVLGVDVAKTSKVAEVASEALKAHGERAREGERKKWEDDSLNALLAGAAPVLSGKAPASSPIAESLTKIILAGYRAAIRWFVVVSDGRQMGLYDFECGQLPKEQAWLDRLHAKKILLPDSLKGVSVAFTFATLPPIKRCDVSVGREVEIRSLWTSAITAAGASDVSFTSGAVSWDEP